MALPASVGRRRVTGTALRDDGTPLAGYHVTAEARPGRLHAAGVTLDATVHQATTSQTGSWQLDLIPWDDPDVDAGVDGPWTYEMSETWGRRLRYDIAVTIGETGDPAADEPLRITDISAPTAPPLVAIVAGPPGPPGQAVADGEVTVAKLAAPLKAAIDAAAPTASPAFTGTPTLNGQPFPSGGSGSAGAVDGGDFDTTPAATLDGGSF